MLSFRVSWADDPQSQVTIEARSPYKAYRTFLEREGNWPDIEVHVQRGSQTETFSNHFEKPKGFLERVRRSGPDPKSREGIYGKSKNDDWGCLLMFLAGPLPFRLITAAVLGIFIIAYQKECAGPERSGNTGRGEVDGQGREIGQWTWKHSNGEIKTQGSYEKGKRVGPWAWWREDGTQKSVETYRNGELDGLCMQWYGNGQKSVEQTYVSGTLRSAATWMPDGTKCPKTNLKDGSGVMYLYDDDGNPKRYLRFKNGEKVGSQMFFTIESIK